MFALRHLRKLFWASRAALSALVVVGLLAANIAPTFAAGGVTGTVQGTITGANGAPLSGAVVSLASPSGSFRATTDASGRFTILGVNVDTYNVSVTASGYDAYSQAGITVSGDQTTGLGTLQLSRTTRTIGTTTARSASSAFQPTQTQDSYTFSGQRVLEAQGKAFNTDQTRLIAAAPGVEVDRLGNLSVRGSLTTEIGLNFDGVPYTQVDHGGANIAFLNGIGSLTVNPGSGDATQSTPGAGEINLIPKRGTSPGFGLFDLEFGSPYRHQQIGLELGVATPDNRFSNYISALGDSFVTALGPVGTSPSRAGITNFGGSTYPNFGQSGQRDVDVLDNFVFKFGPGQNQSLQVLYQNHYDVKPYNIGNGFLPFADANPLALGNVGVDNSAAYLAIAPQIGPLATGQSPQNYFANAPITTAIDNQELLKIEYDATLNPTTFLAARYYAVNYQDVTYDAIGTLFNFGAARAPTTDGGDRHGLIAEITHQFGANNTVTLSTQYEIQQAFFGIQDSIGGIIALTPGAGGAPPLAGTYNAAYDFYVPANTNAPLTFGAGGTNNCPVASGCWLYYLNTTKTFPGGATNPDYGYFGSSPVRMPNNLTDSPQTHPQYWAVALRDQLKLGSSVNVDVGVRYEGTNYHLPSGAVTGNIGPDADTNTPREVEPRLAVTWQIDPNDSLRLGYGRTAQFPLLGIVSTPLDYSYYLSHFPSDPSSVPHAIPGTDFTNFPAAVPANPAASVAGNGCGSGEAGLNGFPYRNCTSYADIIHWSEDYFYPDNGNAKTSTYNNFDATYSHQFKGGYSFRLSPFYRRGQNIVFYGVVASITDPVTGLITPLSFRPFFSGFTQATGAEFYATTPDRPYGLGAFVSATYTNAFSNRPAGAPSEDSQPTILYAALASGNAYRVGFLSPVVANFGLSYKFKSGFRINPIVRFDDGYPYGSGNTTPVVINGVSLNIPQTNNNASLPVAPSASSTVSTNYVDPTNPGTVLHPNIYATRGTPESSSPGGELTHPRAYADVTFEYQATKKSPIIGLAVTNIFNNYYSEPIINTRYEPIATGVVGYQTGQTRTALNPAYVPYGTTNFTSYQFGSSPYLLYPNQPPTQFRVYLQVPL